MFSVHGMDSPIQVIVPLMVLIVCLSFGGWMFHDLLANDDLPSGVKENWAFAFIVFNSFAAVVYYNAVYRIRR